MGEGVTVNISRYPREPKDQAVKQNGLRYYYDSDNGTVLLTDGWYPDLEGTYRKFTHTPKGGSIKEILHNGKPLSKFDGLESHTNISVYYWSLDNTCSKPLLIQLGEGNEYYTTNNGSTWTKQGSMTADILKSKLDGQNCERNQAHIVDLSQKNEKSSSTYYNCLSCNKPKIRVYNGGHYYGHTVSGSFPISGFKNAGTWQTGLSSLKTVSTIRVYWDRSAPNLIVVQFQRGSTDRYFRKNARGGNSWIEVSADSSETALSTTVTTPSVDLDLSNISGKPYTVGSTKVIVAVLDSYIGDGYLKHEHSLRGSLFNVRSVHHGTTPLTDITFSEKLESVSAFYYGVNNPTDLPMPLLVELAIKTSNQTTHKYYQKDKNGNNWTEYPGSGGGTELDNDKLKAELEKLKKEYNLELPSPPLVQKPTPSPPTDSRSSSTPNNIQGNSGHKHHEHNNGGSHNHRSEVGVRSTSAKRNSTSSGVIVGGVIGGILCIAILALFIKRVGPSVKTYMASRRQTLL
ncbi:hypothetical protein BEWA_048820 [Theileria equi strain WA]|uniref:Uncharacterized protein n=1 Tax=Theileria equi strain WA TaxID=1537102 RepID=L1LAV5_THEEQ|nr:hypothetical protein BEWA_048820 [Theileria equi strain WA]EKX72415.1 hypothetical protein BEWA_048820 [Theileria equi strain WA]|eukprot:XP_004831867.1 hypothetical protein BEWA_048820 [Theileria equi strain WA]